MGGVRVPVNRLGTNAPHSITPLRTEEETIGLRGEEGRGGFSLAGQSSSVNREERPSPILDHPGTMWDPPDGLHPVLTSTVVTTPHGVL